MLLLEQAIERSTMRLQNAVTELDKIMSSLPDQLTISEISSVSPLNIGAFS